MKHSGDTLLNTAITVTLVALALLVRAPQLDTFVTLDEPAWSLRSSEFLRGLLDPAYVCGGLPEHSGRQWSTGLECTLRTGHPGVTTMWAGSLGIMGRYVAERMPDSLFLYARNWQDTPAGFASLRWPVVILTSVWVGLIYWLSWQLFGHRLVAALAGLLLALDTFHIAHSRVLHHDALEVMFVLLSLLTALVYWGQNRSRGWLLVSGAAAGAAFLSKSPALLLAPFTGLIILWKLADAYFTRHKLERRQVWRGALDFAIWACCALLAVFVLWPAMWVIPVTALKTVFSIGGQYAGEGHLHYFLGAVVTDPGVAFYPLLVLLRISPLSLLGLAGLAVFVANKRRLSRILPFRRADTSVWPVRHYVFFLCLYALLFVAFMSFGAKKQDRYILVVFALADIVGAVGLAYLVGLAQRHRAGSAWIAGLLAVVLVVQGGLAFVHLPYYFTYYNPLLGGLSTAKKLVTIGWGEGLDQAANYLNQKEQAEQLKVQMASYWQSFLPFFIGQKFAPKNSHEIMNSDYIIFYVNQLQRCDSLQNYFAQYHPPEKVIQLRGVDYVSINRVPLDYRFASPVSRDTDKIVLYGYRHDDSDSASGISLVWQNQGVSPADKLWLALAPYAGSTPALNWQACDADASAAPEVGAILESNCPLTLDRYPPGMYALYVGLGNAAQSAINLLGPAGALGVQVRPDKSLQILTRKEALDSLATALLPLQGIPAHISYGGVLSLVGYRAALSQTGVPTAQFTLFWQPAVDFLQASVASDDFQLAIDLTTTEGVTLASSTEKIMAAGPDEADWQLGQILSDTYTLNLSTQPKSGQIYYLALGLKNSQSGRLIPHQDAVTGEIKSEPVVLPLNVP